MTSVPRTTQTNAHGYLEVSEDYRRARASALNLCNVAELSGKIACPMLEASRSTNAYGEMALAVTDSKRLDEWSEALGVSSMGIKVIAYLSGVPSKIPGNFVFGRFNDKEVNRGFIRSIKNGVNTGVLGSSQFSESAMRQFVSSFRPELNGEDITQDWLYSDAASSLYLDHTNVPNVIDYNVANAKGNRLTTFLGRQMSSFEIRKLLVGVLAQDVSLNSNISAGKIKAILVRDIYDLYKYGWLPVPVEERLSSAGLISIDETNLSA